MLVTADDGAHIYVEAEADDSKPPLLFSNSLGTNLHIRNWPSAPVPLRPQ